MGQTNNLSLGESVVWACIKSIENVGEIEQCQFFFDNFFTSYKLLLDLKKRNLKATGTCRRNRLGSCVLPEDKSLGNRGDYNHYAMET